MRYLPLLLLLCVCCTTNKNKLNQLVAYINEPDNHLIHHWDIQGVQSHLLYYPQELLNSTGEKFKENIYFKFTLSANGEEATRHLAGNRLLYSKVIQQLQYKFEQLIHIKTNEKEVIYPIGSWSSPTFGMAHENAVFIVFNKSELEATESFRVIINEFGLKTGKLYATYNKKDIISIPH